MRTMTILMKTSISILSVWSLRFGEILIFSAVRLLLNWRRNETGHKRAWYKPTSTGTWVWGITVYPKKYAQGFCFAVLCCGYTLTDFPISIRLTSLALWQSNDCPSASKATLMNMDKYFIWFHYERLHNHNKAKHNKTVCIFLGIYCRIDAISHSLNHHGAVSYYIFNKLGYI